MGTLFHTLPVLAPTIARSTGWPMTAEVASFTGSEVVAAASSVVVGRRIQRTGPRGVMAGRAVVSGLLA